MIPMLALVPAALALPCTGLNADTCDAVNALVPLVNAQVGSELLSDTAAARFRPETLYTQLEQVRIAASAQGCRVDGSFEGWDGGVYGRTTWSGDYERRAGETGSSSGSLDRPGQIYEGDWVAEGGGGGAIGDQFAGYHASGAFGSNRGTGWSMGRWVRRTGAVGVFVGLHGTCDAGVDVAAAFEPWYPGTFTVFGDGRADCAPPTVDMLAALAPVGASDLVFDDECRAWIGTIISGTDSVWGIDGLGTVTSIPGENVWDIGAVAIDPATGGLAASFTDDSGTAFFGRQVGALVTAPAGAIGTSPSGSSWANLYLNKSASSIAIDTAGCAWFPNWSGAGSLHCHSTSGPFTTVLRASLGGYVESVALDSAGAAYASVGGTIFRIGATPGDVTVHATVPGNVLDMVFDIDGDLYVETTNDVILRVAPAPGPTTTFASVLGDGKLALSPDGTLVRGRLNPTGAATWESWDLDL